MYSGECWFTLTLRMLPFYAPKWDRRRTLGVVLLALVLQMMYVMMYLIMTELVLGSNFSTFFRLFSLGMTEDNMLLAPLHFCEWMED
jgi:hypothetical protein